ncbi:MAG: HAD family hydrolase [Bacteroidetes bacterium]|nr:HAD family hydrolase [Bacteroidota bacterium]
MNKGIFLDRDGVLNEDFGYVYRWEDFKFLPGVIESLRLFSFYNYKLIIVTNQSGIGRGFYSTEEFWILTKKMQSYLEGMSVQIDGVYFCPHLPIEDQEVETCLCRKPLPGLILQAADEHDIDLSLSVMVGDKPSDTLAGKAAGLGLNVLLTRQERKDGENCYPDLVSFANDFLKVSCKN